ncbi:MAG TPA: MG2 domain-containing protein [Polyangia bacterium]
MRRLILALLWVVVMACGGAQPQERARVVKLGPSGDAAAPDLARGISLMFDRPIVAPDAVGRELARPPVALTPRVPGRARWIDRQTLVFVPAEALRGDTRYRVAVEPGLRPAGGGPAIEWSGGELVYDRLRLMSVVFGAPDSRYQPASPAVELTFNLPVAADAVAFGCLFDGPAGAVPATAQPKGVAPARSVVVRPARALRAGAEHHLRCAAGLRAAGGDAGLAQGADAGFRTYGPLAVDDVAPRGQDAPADDVAVELVFSNPVAADEVRRKVILAPAARPDRPVRVPLAGAERRRYRATLSLEPGAEYVLTVKGGLADAFGQKLGRDLVHRFRVGDASPRLSLKQGIYAVEAAYARYPVWTRNLAGFDLTCARVPERRITALLTGLMNYDAWFDASSDGPVDFAKQGLTGHQRRVRIAHPKNAWYDASVDLAATCGGDAARPGGLYLLDVTSPDLGRGERRRVLANVTDLGLVAKVGNASSLVWVVRLSSGAPVSGATVEIRDLKGKVRYSAVTGPQGTVDAPGATKLVGLKPRPAPRPGPAANGGEGDGEGDGEDFEDFRGRRVIVTARLDTDLAVLDTNWNNGIQVWNFGVPEDRRGGAVRVRGFLQSDRGLYRPGDTVHLRGLARVIEPAGRMRLPRERRLHLTVEDPRGAAVVDADVPLSRFGGFSRDLPLTADARLGDYHVTGTLDGQTFRERFAVEEYRPRTFELTVAAGARHQFLGERLRYSVSASYLYGAPVGQGKLTWAVRRRPYVPSFPGLPQFGFGDLAALWDEGSPWADGERRSLSDPVADGERALDAAGRAAITARDDARARGPFEYLLDATVTDPAGQAVTTHAVTTAHRAGLYLGLHPAERVQAVNMPFAVQAVALAPDGARRPAEAVLTLARRRYECAEGARWGRCGRTEETPALTRAVAVPATGVAVTRVVLKEPGEYLVRLVAPDGRGGQALSTDIIYVIGEGEAFWSGDEGDRMGLIASKPSYRPGEVARVVPQTQLPGALALVTVERDGIVRSFTTRLAKSGQGIDIRVDDALAPNAYAAVTLVRGRTGPGAAGRPRFKMGLVNLAVDTQHKRLAVQLETDKPSYRPGETVYAALKVTGADGRPVRAELAVAAADEGVLQIVGYETPDPMKVFYAPWGLGVESATTWNRIAQRRDPAAADSEEGGDAGGDEAGRVRSRFMATAFWAPAVTTDEGGTARLSFRAPDNLTAFRLMAVAADAGDRFGNGALRFTVAKPLAAMPALPRFLSTGDELTAAVVLHNHTGAAGRASVTLEARGVALRGPARREVDVPAGATRPVVFTVSARRPGTARFRFAATLGAASDTVEVAIPVSQPVAREATVLAEAATSGTAEVPVALPAGVLPGEGGLELSLDTSGVGRLDESVRYLVGYPYGCLEQTTSRVVPMVALKDLTRTLDLGVSRGALNGFVEAGLAKIYRHQHEDGAFGLWPGAPAEAHLTAYALWGLALAKQAGYAVDAKAVAAGAASLRKAVTADTRVDARAHAGSAGARAFALYVLGVVGRPEPGAAARLYEERAGLPLYGKALLARALARAGQPALAQQLVGEIAAAAPAGTGAAVLREPDEDRLWYYLSSAPRTTAIVLSALIEVAPGHPLIPRLADGLLGAREQGRWSNTQENLYALVALADLARARRAGAPAKVSVTLGGRALVRGTLAPGEVRRVAVPMAKLAAGTLRIEAGGHEVYYTARLRVARALAPQPVDAGFTVARQYLDPASGAAVERVTVGQTVKVRLTVRAARQQAHVAVVDHLPAGLEPVLDRARRAAELAQPWWLRDRATVWEHRQLRDDRVEIFTEVLVAGASSVEYLARATSAGVFVAPPATAEAMYRPAIAGRSGAESLTVTR